MTTKQASQLTTGDVTPYGTVAGTYPWTSVKGQAVLTVEFTDSMSQTRFPDELVTVYGPYA